MIIMANYTGYLKDKDGNKIYPNDYDTGWSSIDLASNVRATNNDNYPVRQRKIGNVVYLEGLVELTATATASDTMLGTVKYLPKYKQYLCGTTSMAEDGFGNKAKVIRIDPDGSIYTHGSKVDVSRWISFYGISYLVD